MAIKDRDTVMHQRKIEIDLTGPAGNVYAVIGLCMGIARQLGWSKDYCREYSDRLFKLKDYDGIIEKLDDDFGDYVDFLK